MILTALILILCIVSLLQKNEARFYAGVIFSVVTICGELLLPELDGILYYLSDAILLLAFIHLSSKINSDSSAVFSLQILVLIAIVADFAGWVAWMIYAPPALYNASFLLIYSAAIIILLRREHADVDIRDGTTIRGRPGIHCNNASRHIFDSKKEII